MIIPYSVSVCKKRGKNLDKSADLWYAVVMKGRYTTMMMISREYYENEELRKRIDEGIALILSGKVDRLPLGRTEISETCYVKVMEYDTKLSAGEMKYEAHRAYADIQYILSGHERCGVAKTAGLAVTDPYDAEKDVLFGTSSDGGAVTLRSGDWIVFLPDTAHAPSLADPQPSPVRKAVVKVLLP